MNNKKTKDIITIVTTLVLLIAIVGISYAAFNYAGTGEKLNTITTGMVTMEYVESTNTITMTNALPTTIATGKTRLTAGEYFDFTVKSSIAGNTDINYEIAAKEESGNTFSGNNIRYYLTTVDANGKETEVMAPRTYYEEPTGNGYTGRPADMMSLYTGNLATQGETEIKYRLRLWVDENFGSSQTTSVNGNTSTGTITGFTFKFVVSIGVDNTNTEHYNITNMAQNGSFENTGWSTSSGGVYDSSIKKYGNYSLKVIGNTSASEITVSAKTTMALDNTHKYYVRYEIYHTGSSGTVGFYFPIAEPYFFEGVALSTANKWNVISKVNNRSSFSTNSSTSYRVDYNNNNSAGVVYFDGLMVVDLTETFGAGNEKSKEWCDTNIPFFEGTKDIIINN